MKFDILYQVKDSLYQEGNGISENTARKYFSSLKKLFKGIYFSDVREIDQGVLENLIMDRFKTKNELSAIKNSLIRFKEVFPELQIPDEKFFTEYSKGRKNRSKKPAKVLSHKDTNQKIDSIEEEKLQLAYRLILNSGLRISEAASLRKDDLRFTDGIITVSVKKGKGGSTGVIECLEDKKLYSELQDYVEKCESECLFYSEEYMRKRAYAAGFEPHDLRRIFSQRMRRQLQKKMNTYEANKQVQQSLRHKRFSTTKRYLFNRKLHFDEMEEEE